MQSTKKITLILLATLLMPSQSWTKPSKILEQQTLDVSTSQRAKTAQATDQMITPQQVLSMLEASHEMAKDLFKKKTPLNTLSLAQQDNRPSAPKGVSVRMYKEALVAETGLLTENEQKTLKNNVMPIFTAHLEIDKARKKIQKADHEKKSAIFDSDLPMKYAFDELFEQIYAKDYAIKLEELTEYVAEKEPDKTKLNALRQQKAYLEMQYEVMLFLGSLLDTAPETTSRIFKLISTDNRGTKYSANLRDIIRKAFGQSIEGCPNVVIDQEFVIGLQSIVDESNKIRRNNGAQVKAKIEILSKVRTTSPIEKLTEVLEHNTTVAKQQSMKLIQYAKRITVPSSSSLIMQEANRKYYTKMFHNNFSKDVFNVQVYVEVMLLGVETFSRMKKEVKDIMEIFEKCDIPQNDREEFYSAVIDYTKALIPMTKAIAEIYNRIIAVENYIIGNHTVSKTFE